MQSLKSITNSGQYVLAKVSGQIKKLYDFNHKDRQNHPLDLSQ